MTRPTRIGTSTPLITGGMGSSTAHDASAVAYDNGSSGLTADDVQEALDELAAGGASALDDLTDVTLTTPAVGDRLRYDGAEWVNSTYHWEPLVDGTGLVLLDGLGNILRQEVEY